MASCRWGSPLVLLWLVVHAVASDPKLLGAVPSTAGVFMVPADGRYSYDAAAATAACLRRNATLATELRMEAARQSGLQTCKYDPQEEEVVRWDYR
ncbi:hypothetical protein NHX12_003097 [Muraenolepis orangiensis]|uniref:Link domain-containing protein n=1 Tax=Muraenolepis orangiensis TaxID=630683 RepID=A0A9Q0DYH1_9TELE|nr:hypothetical protein NHX12_003097 [Muraenolepis orangiensis]